MSGHLVETADAVRFLASLPAASADCIVTDPPYSSGGFNESQRRGGSSTSGVMPHRPAAERRARGEGTQPSLLGEP